jgi:transcriptional activator of cad operon
MDFRVETPLRIGAWHVDPLSGQMTRNGEIVRIDARTMRLLLHLCQRAGEVVSIADLLEHVWSGVVVTPDSVYQGVATLRRLLGDDPKRPSYIVTVPRLGYRMVANVAPWIPDAVRPATHATNPNDPSPSGTANEGGFKAASPDVSTKRPHARARGILIGLSILAVVLLLGASLVHYKNLGGVTRAHQRTIAVLPFLDLTSQKMGEEYFADGMTEELIDKLSKIPNLRVSSPTSSFYFKGKSMALGDIARSLGVTYVLDGSVRQSDVQLRIAVRLVRASDGYVIWSASYDRPLADKLKMQDEIAAEVAQALRTTLR